MRKYWYRKILIIVAAVTTVLGSVYYGWQFQGQGVNQEVSADKFQADAVLLGGMPAGIYMETKGVLVLATEEVEDPDGIECEPARNLVRPGDYIIGMNGNSVSNKEDLVQELNSMENQEVILELSRKEEVLSVRFQAVCVGKEEYKLGIWVRDDTQGLGTITYLTQNSKFGALGHGIHDVDTNELLSISTGSLYDTGIRSVIKGQIGHPGSMEGIIVYNKYNKLGTIEKNTDAGIFGTLDKMDRLFEEQIAVETASKETIEPGAAQIRCCIGEEINYYDIEIMGIDLYPKEINKGLVIQVTDPELLKKTGGIIQGMSGSPILQNGKLVGAVTHVFVNDPTKGYGIFIENMLDSME